MDASALDTPVMPFWIIELKAADRHLFHQCFNNLPLIFSRSVQPTRVLRLACSLRNTVVQLPSPAFSILKTPLLTFNTFTDIFGRDVFQSPTMFSFVQPGEAASLRSSVPTRLVDPQTPPPTPQDIGLATM